MIKIKLCGIKRIEDVNYVNECKPEYIGFVFWQKSKRNVSKDTAKLLKSKLLSSIKTVGVFVDADIDFIISLYRDNIIDLAQLHGSEDKSYIKTLQAENIPVIKAFIIKDKSDVKSIEKTSADYILLDSGKGSGKNIDFELIKDIKKPYFLAGGLDCDNISDIVKTIRPFGVDVSSGIETNGIKDKDKMKLFVDKVRKMV